MPEVISCVGLEWGWTFWGPLLAAGVILIALIGSLLVRARSGGVSFSWKEFKVAATADQVRVVVVIVLLIIVVVLAYEGFTTIKDAHFVSLDAPGGRALEQVRDDLQSETHLVVTIKEPAKKFTVAGEYRGACVADLFNAICRKYAERLTCDVSSLNRTLTVDLRRR